MGKNEKCYKYIALASIREYFELNKINIHKFSGYMLFMLVLFFIVKASIYAGLKYFWLLNIIMLIMIFISFQSAEFDNFISYCQDDNKKILLSYPIDAKNNLFCIAFKNTIFHMMVINLILIPLFLVGIYIGEDILFLIKYVIFTNISCILFVFISWGKWISKWKQIKLSKKNIFKDIIFLILSISAILAYKYFISNNFPMNKTLEVIKNLNNDNYNILDKYYFWFLLIGAVISVYFLQKVTRNKLVEIYNFYVLNNNSKNNMEIKYNTIKKYNIFKKIKIGIKLKKEFMAIFRNKNIVNEIKNKIKLSIIFSLVLGVVQLLQPIKIDYYVIEIIIIFTATSYGDKIIKSYLPIASKNSMIINYIQSGISIKKILFNKVKMLFIYRQFFIIGPLIIMLCTTKFNIIMIVHFLLIWLIVSYTSAQIKIYSVSINSHYLATDDSMNKLNIFDALKYIAIESTYSYLIFMIVLIGSMMESSYFITAFLILWISVVFNIIVLLLQGDGRKFYGEYKEYI